MKYKSKLVGCDNCGELKPSTDGSKQVHNGQFQKVFLCDDCKPIISKSNYELNQLKEVIIWTYKMQFNN